MFIFMFACLQPLEHLTVETWGSLHQSLHRDQFNPVFCICIVSVLSGISFTTSIQTLESYCLGTFLAKEFINIFTLSWSQYDFYPLICLITPGDIHSFQTSCLDNKIHCSIIQNSHEIPRFITPSVFFLTGWLTISFGIS